MPTSATGCSSRPGAARGFTLIELLVVLAILGVLSVGVTLTLNTNPRANTGADAERLALLLEEAALETQAGGRQLAWSAEAGGYSFWERAEPADRRWQEVADDDRFRSRRFDGGLRVDRIEVDGQLLPASGLLVFRRGSPPLFRIVLGAAAPGTAPPTPVIELRGTATGKVDIRKPASS